MSKININKNVQNQSTFTSTFNILIERFENPSLENGNFIWKIVFKCGMIGYIKGPRNVYLEPNKIFNFNLLGDNPKVVFNFNYLMSLDKYECIFNLGNVRQKKYGFNNSWSKFELMQAYVDRAKENVEWNVLISKNDKESIRKLNISCRRIAECLNFDEANLPIWDTYYTNKPEWGVCLQTWTREWELFPNVWSYIEEILYRLSKKDVSKELEEEKILFKQTTKDYITNPRIMNSMRFGIFKFQIDRRKLIEILGEPYEVYTELNFWAIKFRNGQCAWISETSNANIFYVRGGIFPTDIEIDFFYVKVIQILGKHAKIIN